MYFHDLSAPIPAYAIDSGLIGGFRLGSRAQPQTLHASGVVRLGGAGIVAMGGVLDLTECRIYIEQPLIVMHGGSIVMGPQILLTGSSVLVVLGDLLWSGAKRIDIANVAIFGRATVESPELFLPANSRFVVMPGGHLSIEGEGSLSGKGAIVSLGHTTVAGTLQVKCPLVNFGALEISEGKVSLSDLSTSGAWKVLSAADLYMSPESRLVVSKPHLERYGSSAPRSMKWKSHVGHSTGLLVSGRMSVAANARVIHMQCHDFGGFD